jgi:tetratricopeptide (TPR) repeat protein
MNGGKAQNAMPGGKPAGKPNRQPSRPSAISSTLYERYKDALRRGHVAALRGRNDAAIEAYQEAASIAPDRALPHASMGGILVKLNRPADAVAAYERALALAPRDEAALRGLAETLTRLGRRPAAADTLDRLAVALEAGGRTADATDAARRAMELAETPERRARVQELVERLRTMSPIDEAAERALSQALIVLEPPVAAAAATPSFIHDAVEAAPRPGAEPPPEVVEEPAIEEMAPTGEIASEVAEALTEPVEAAAAAAEEQPEPVEAPAAAAEEQPEPEIHEPVGLGIALGAAAEAQLFAGHLAEAHSGLLAAARAHRRADRLVAAIDACYLAIGLAPADPELHLLLAEIYLDRGWRTQAADKLVLLARLADLDDDPATRERLCAIVTARLADEPRVAELCA